MSKQKPTLCCECRHMEHDQKHPGLWRCFFNPVPRKGTTPGCKYHETELLRGGR